MIHRRISTNDGRGLPGTLDDSNSIYIYIYILDITVNVLHTIIIEKLPDESTSQPQQRDQERILYEEPLLFFSPLHTTITKYIHIYIYIY